VLFKDMSESKKNISAGIAASVFLIVVAGLLFLGWFFNRPLHSGVQHVYCINNLRQIDVAAQEFALEKGKTNGEAINFPDDLTPYIKLNSAGKIPLCPQGGFYTLKKVGDKPTCSLGTKLGPPHVLP